MLPASPDAEHLPCAVASIDTNGRLLSVNRALCALIGQPAANLVGQAFDRLLSPAGAVVYQTYLMPLLRLHGQLEEFAIPLKAADPAGTVDVLMYASSRGDGLQRVHDVVMVAIRQRRRVEEEFVRVKRAADESPGMIFQLLCTPEGHDHFPYVSEAVRTLYHTTPQAARSGADAVFGAVLPEDRVGLLGARDDAGRADLPWRASARVRAPDGGVAWHEFNASARRMANGVTLWHGYVADVTQRRAMEQALAARETERQASQAKSEFLARVSHELRTPLNGILGFAHLLGTQDADNLRDEQRRRLAIMKAAGESLLHLINEVLDITSIEMGQLSLRTTSVPLDAALDAALALVEPMAQAARVSLLRANATGLVVQADERRLGQVLGNLLSNGIKYNRVGGHVALQVRGPDGVGRATIDVVDTGPGLSESQQRQLFQPFNRLGAEAGPVEGSGLGLVISRHLVQLMQGELSVVSAPGAGSTFRVRLPAVAPVVGARPGPAAAVAGEALPAARGRVLYVEDNHVNVLLMEAIVGLRPGLCLQVCSSCAEGLAAALANPPALLMLDMHLPDGDGVGLLQALRRHGSLAAVPAVAVSAATRRDDLQRARDAGFVAYWTKPLMVDQVLDGLDRVLGLNPP